MKYVHDPKMVYHIWSHQSQPEARNSTGNVSFSGTRCYSYAACIANIVNGAVLISNRSWSNTTSRHQSYMRRACSHMRRFTVLLVEREHDWHKRNLADYKERIRELAARAFRARGNKEFLLRELEALTTQANEYAEFFKLKTRLKAPVDADKLQEMIVQAAKAGAAANAKREKKEKEIQAKQLEYYNERLQDWLAGNDVTLPYNDNMDIRLRVRGSRIETTKGAIVEIESAKPLLHLIRAGKHWMRVNYQNCTTTEPIQVGDFELDEVTAEGNIRIGCHFIKREEIERLAKELNL